MYTQVTFCPALSESTSGVNPKPVLYRTLFYAGTSLLNTACPYHAANRFEWSRGDSNPCVVHVSIQYQQYQSVVRDLHPCSIAACKSTILCSLLCCATHCKRADGFYTACPCLRGRTIRSPTDGSLW